MRDTPRTHDAEPAAAITLSGRLLIDNALFNKGTAFTVYRRLVPA